MQNAYRGLRTTKLAVQMIAKQWTSKSNERYWVADEARLRRHKFVCVRVALRCFAPRSVQTNAC